MKLWPLAPWTPAAAAISAIPSRRRTRSPRPCPSGCPECGGQFVQAESEVAAINMLLGAGACGIPAMTSSSSCGISLMQEGISYMAGSHIPAVIVNMERGGPGLGDIGPRRATTSRPSRAAVTATTATWCWPPPPRRNATT